MNPNGSAVLVGESAMMEYVIKSGQLDGDDGNEGNAGDKSKGGNEGDDGNKGNEGDKNTLNDLFGSSSDSDVELSQEAVTREFDLSPTELEQHHDAAQSLQLLSEASGMESDSQLDPLPATAPAHRARRNIKTDVNYIPETENMNAYESCSSGSSDDNVNEDNSDSDDLNRGYRDEQDDVVSEDDAIEMDQAFVDSLRLGDDASRPQAVQQRENALRAAE
ncbi:hypothetical protein F444_13635 [Phytophthora nicotianae P1976]|uniref:Uncharacterized protein n=1 Tax=Phytophthora nicotianae P1976 TaxID=1317066 RepID=A0A080ZT86_PHYNI|nr:hypothetical protein F444_13635 [Phytophthora nicotianae P1976]